MSKRGLLPGVVLVLLLASLAGCLGDDTEVDVGDDSSDDGGDGSGNTDGNGGTGDGSGSGDGGNGGNEGGSDVEGAPTAAFVILLNETNATAGTPIDFDASNSSDPEGENLTYVWDFGDNATAEGVTINHTYAADGNYTITLTVTDESGLSDTTNQTLAVVNGTVEPGELGRVSDSVLLPNPAIALFSNAGLQSLDDHKANGGQEGTHWNVHTFEGVPEGINELRFAAEYSTADSQTVMKLAIKVFPEDGSEPVATSSFPSGRPDITLEGDKLGESTYHVFVYTGTGASIDYELTVTYA